MPPTKKQTWTVPLHEVVNHSAYPAEAFEFVKDGLNYTVSVIHPDVREPRARLHVTGQELCLGLREYALMQWGMLAPVVLRRWNIRSTLDFGRIVFTMIEQGFMSKTEQDNIDDFRHVYQFQNAFEAEYRIRLT